MTIPSTNRRNDRGALVLVGIGSNIAPEKWIPESLIRLAGGLRELRVGPFFLTRPLGGRTEQPPYVNGVAAGLTDRPAHQVLAWLHQIEEQLGRVRNPQDRYASRIIDLDLLAWGDLIDRELGLPDPDLLDRDFYLYSASRAAPDFIHPESGLPLRELARRHTPAQQAMIRTCRLALPAGIQTAGPEPADATSGAGERGLPAPVLAAGTPWTAIGLRAVLLGLAIYGGVCLFMYVRQPALVFFPDRTVETVPEDAGMPYEDLYLPVPDAAAPDRINAWFVPCQRPARGVVLFCHGNAGDLGDRIDTIRILRDLDFDVFVFDYRGYGRSTGKPSETALYEDAEACWRYLTVTRGVPPERICVHGRSLGGPVAARIAAEHGPPGALVLESTFTSLPEMGQRLYPWLPVRRLARYRFPTIDFVGRVQCPVVVIHSPEDDLVPYDMGRRLFAVAPEPKTFIEIHGDHMNGFLDSEPVYVAGLQQALAPWFPRETDADAGESGEAAPDRRRVP